MRKTLTYILLLCCLSLQGIAQDQTKQLSKDFKDFFTGEWSGDGQFASGKKISADVSITPSLNGQWLSYHHQDKSPNQYEASAMWGIDKQTGEFLAYTFDNFQGHRKFTSDGWKDDKLIISLKETTEKLGTVYQHFIYEKLGSDSFKMTFETSRDGVAWRMIDNLIFRRKK